MPMTMPAQEIKRHDSFVNGCLASEAEYRQGLASRTTADELMSEITSGLDDESST